jgi:HEAT repeat protein
LYAVILAASAAMGATPSAAAPAEKQAPLIATLRSGAPPAEKAMACKKLAIYGTGEAVPALAPLLADEQLASWARIALEAIPDPAAGEALRASLGKLHGKLLVGAINSIGVRRDAVAVAGLVARLADADAEVAAASAAALGRIGGAEAAAALRQAIKAGRPEVRNAAAEGCALAAEKFLAAGQRDAAIGLYDLVRKADVPKPRIVEATRGAILARGSAGVPLLVEQLRSPDKAMFAIGLRTARELPGPEVTDALLAELKRAVPDRQALLIIALDDRRDDASTGVIARAARSGPKTVRIAALRMMGRSGDLSCIGEVLEAVTADDPEISQMAASIVAESREAGVDDLLRCRLSGEAEGKARKALIEVVGRRRVAAALPMLLEAADDPDAAIRSAALTALGATVGMKDLPLLIARTVKPRDAEEAKAAEDALRAACVRMPDREACAEKLVAALAGAPGPAKVKLLETLAAVGGVKALQAVATAAKDADEKLQDAGTRLLGQWPTPDAAPALLDLAKTAADEKYKTRALRGYLRIARQFEPLGPKRVAMCRDALPLCRRDEEKKLVVEILRRSPSAESLALATAQLGNPALKQAAAAAAVAIAEKIVPSEPQAVAEAMNQILAAAPDRATAARAKDLKSATDKAASP